MKPTMEEANIIHLEALDEQQDQFAASVMLGNRKKAEEPEEEKEVE